mmetsp:Transcript_28531/g.53483  ORF Transcript_28531/g.53483 Transcript_28531/m.53483 type:complete len:145 (-) Transcript_28531:225-659(-)
MLYMCVKQASACNLHVVGLYNDSQRHDRLDVEDGVSIDSVARFSSFDFLAKYWLPSSSDISPFVTLSKTVSISVINTVPFSAPASLQRLNFAFWKTFTISSLLIVPMSSLVIPNSFEISSLGDVLSFANDSAVIWPSLSLSKRW